MPREFLRITPETTPGTFNSTGAHTIIDIEQSNAYTVRPRPITVDIRTAGAFNRRWKRVSKKASLEGTLNWLMHGSQAAVFVDWSIAASNALKSYTVDHCVMMEDDSSTKIYSRDLGVYVRQAELLASEQDQVLRAQLQLVGMERTVIAATDFPTPVLTDFPTDAILTFEDASAGLSLHTASRLDLESFHLTIKNLIDVRYFVALWPQKLKYCGRDIDWTSRLAYSAAIPRADYEAQTPLAAAIIFNNGTNALTLNLNSQNYYGDVQDQIDHSKVFLQEINLSSFVDSATGDELNASAT